MQNGILSSPVFNMTSGQIVGYLTFSNFYYVKHSKKAREMLPITSFETND